MSYISQEEQEAARRRKRVMAAILASMRELSIQLGLLNHHVGAHVELKDIDLDCLDLIARHGPLSPSALARRSGLHPATMTGILDRLERGGWVARDRDPSDRRAVVVRMRGERMGELMGLYSGMLTSMREICAGYEESQLEVIADFLNRTAHAGRSATDELAGD